jgi:hypothetical protein
MSNRPRIIPFIFLQRTINLSIQYNTGYFSTGMHVQTWQAPAPDGGSLTFGGRYIHPNGVSVDVLPYGNHVYVAAGNADAVSWFSRDK